MWHLLLAPALLLPPEPPETVDCARVERATAIEAIADAANCVVSKLGFRLQRLYVDPSVAQELAPHMSKSEMGRAGTITLDRLQRDCGSPRQGCRIRGDNGLLRLREFDQRPATTPEWIFRAEVFASHVVAGQRWHICPNLVAGTLAQAGNAWVVTYARVTETC